MVAARPETELAVIAVMFRESPVGSAFWEPIASLAKNVPCPFSYVTQPVLSGRVVHVRRVSCELEAARP